jgi:hypothetical protein
VRHMMRPSDRAEIVGKELKRKKGQERGERGLIQLESGGWSVHAPSPKRRQLHSGGQTGELR